MTRRTPWADWGIREWTLILCMIAFLVATPIMAVTRPDVVSSLAWWAIPAGTLILVLGKPGGGGGGV